ncbi:tRNA pseudouridine(55) synthase TruB [bacterium]|nr:tRNA pseudouridine(55) synthase TruB [bacterium]
MADLSGIVSIAKPPGLTSRDVVNRIQRLVKPAKVGHAGTLDPMATGVLVVAVGVATRLVSHVQRMRKTYRATFRLGITTDSDDVTGTVLTQACAEHITRDQVATALQSCVGTIQQVPPQVSAVHVDGQRAYDLARQGVTFELAPRPVDVYSLQLCDWNPPDFGVELECGSGTYVRSIGRDVGMALGCGATMTSLVRTAIGGFVLQNALSIENLNRETVSEALLPCTSAVPDMTQLIVSSEIERAIRCGQQVPSPSDMTLPCGQEVAWVDALGNLVGIGVVTATGDALQPRLILHAL